MKIYFHVPRFIRKQGERNIVRSTIFGNRGSSWLSDAIRKEFIASHAECLNVSDTRSRTDGTRTHGRVQACKGQLVGRTACRSWAPLINHRRDCRFLPPPRKNLKHDSLPNPWLKTTFRLFLHQSEIHLSRSCHLIRRS
jgi:hypothetical protein